MEDYFLNQEMYVYPLEIKEKNKVRRIITYKKNDNGIKLRNAHLKILNELESYPSSPHSYAYKKGISTIDALQSHLKSVYFIKIDIKDFFQSIDYNNFIEIVSKYFPLTNPDTSQFKICFHNNYLSPGFITSPKLSDMYLFGFDQQMENILLRNIGLHFSRYSDDILISAEKGYKQELCKLFDYIIELLDQFYLAINYKKVRKVDLFTSTSISYLGVNISRDINKPNKLTLSKNYILTTLNLFSKYDKISKNINESIVDEEKVKKLESYKHKLKSIIKGRVEYIKNISEITFLRLLKKYKNRFLVDPLQSRMYLEIMAIRNISS